MVLMVVTTAQGNEISIGDVSATPDGSTTRFGQNYDVETLNGGVKVLLDTATPGETEVAYIVTTFNFGIGTSADIGVGFDHTYNDDGDVEPSRMGVEARDGGVITWFNGPTQNTNMGSSLAGQSLTLIIKFDMDDSRGGNDTIGSFWVNPASSSTEGAPDVVSSAWNSENFPELILYIDNESTPGTAGDSSITDTVLLTGADATFQNALDLALAATVVTLSHNEVATNAVPGTLVGSLTGGPSGTDAFVLTNAPSGGNDADNAKFQITGTTNLNTAVWMSKQTNYISIAAVSNGLALVTNSLEVIVIPASSLVFRVSAEVSNSANNGDTIGTMTVDNDAGATFSIVGGRTDLFTTDGSDKLLVTNQASWGAVGTTNFVTIRASSSAGSSDLTIGAVVVSGIPDASVFRFR